MVEQLEATVQGRAHRFFARFLSRPVGVAVAAFRPLGCVSALWSIFIVVACVVVAATLAHALQAPPFQLLQLCCRFGRKLIRCLQAVSYATGTGLVGELRRLERRVR